MPIQSEIRRPAIEWIESGSLRRISLCIGYRCGVDRDEIEDLVQEVAIAVLRIGSATRLNSTYVYRTAIRKAVDILRKRGRGSGRVPPPDLPRPSESELQCLVRAKVAHLPVPLRVVFELRYQEGLTEREVSQLLHLPRGVVRGLEAKLLRSV